MSRTILLADDSITIQKVVELTFLKGDYQVVSLDNGDDALRQLDAVAPDLVIADIHMPGATGYDVARRVKQGTPQIPVLLLVGTFEPFDETDIEASGADGFLLKPFDSQELLSRVEELFEASSPRATPDASDVPSSPVEPSEPPQAPTEESSEKVPAPEVDSPPVTESAGGSAAESPLRLSDEEIDRIARRVAAEITPEIVREVAREIIPEVAEIVIKERIHQLEQEAE